MRTKEHLLIQLSPTFYRNNIYYNKLVAKQEETINLQIGTIKNTQPPSMRLHPVAFYFKSHTSSARDTRNAAGVIGIFVLLSVTLFGPLLFSPKNDVNSMGGTQTSLLSAHHQIVSSDRREMIAGDVEQRKPISVLLKDQGKSVLQNISTEQEMVLDKVLQNISTEQEMVLDKVDHAKLANVVSISASAAILLGAFTAGKVAKRRLGRHSAGGGGVFVESDSNAGRISDDVAYDIAYTYTSTASEISYGSFTSTWAGDLEKFDV